MQGYHMSPLHTFPSLSIYFSRTISHSEVQSLPILCWSEVGWPKWLCINESLIITHICTFHLSTFNFLLSRRLKTNVKVFIFLKVMLIHTSSAFYEGEFWSDETIKVKICCGEYCLNSYSNYNTIIFLVLCPPPEFLLRLCDSHLFFWCYLWSNLHHSNLIVVLLSVKRHSSIIEKKFLYTWLI